MIGLLNQFLFAFEWRLKTGFTVFITFLNIHMDQAGDRIDIILKNSFLSSPEPKAHE